MFLFKEVYGNDTLTWMEMSLRGFPYCPTCFEPVTDLISAHCRACGLFMHARVQCRVALGLLRTDPDVCYACLGSD